MKQTWKSCWRVHIALLLNFLPPEVEKTQQIQEKHLFWSHLVLILCESVGIALSHLKEMFLATNFFVWPLWAITDLPAFFPTFSPKITPTQPCSWPLAFMSSLASLGFQPLWFAMSIAPCALAFGAAVISQNPFSFWLLDLDPALCFGRTPLPPPNNMLLFLSTYAQLLVASCFYFPVHPSQLPCRSLF